MRVSRKNVGLLTASVVVAAAWTVLPGCSDENASLSEAQGSGGAAGQGGVSQDASAGGSSGAAIGGSGGSSAGGASGSSSVGGASGAETGGGSPDAGTGGTVQNDAAPDAEPEASAPVCATTAQCEALWQNDPCKANIECDGATSTCKFKVLDKDGDGHPPVVCGGDDCDDSTPDSAPGKPEHCDDRDNDCDGQVDDGLKCHAAEGPSCSGGLDCHGTSCCANALVPGGTFAMGRSAAETQLCGPDAECLSAELPEHSVVVSDFYLDIFETTVGRLRKFVEHYDGQPLPAGAGAHPKIPGSGWNAAWNSSVKTQAELLNALASEYGTQITTWTASPGPNEHLPANNVAWWVAFMFCAWDGGRLPTEAEWEYAASAGGEGRVYPWGTATPDDAHALYGAIFDYCPFDGKPECTVADISEVGTRVLGIGKFGQFDLAGSLTESTLDAYDITWYSGAGATCSDCANTGAGTYRSTRGGSWRSTWGKLRASNRAMIEMATITTQAGVRCARD